MVVNISINKFKGSARLQLQKEILREVANKARIHKLRCDSSDFARDMILNTIARTVARQECQLAGFLCSRHKVAQDNLRFRDGRVFFKDHPKLSDSINETRVKVVSEQVREGEKNEARSPNRRSARSRLLQNCMKLWVRFEKRLVIDGVFGRWCSFGFLPEMAEALKRFWPSIFELRSQETTNSIFSFGKN